MAIQPLHNQTREITTGRVRSQPGTETREITTGIGFEFEANLKGMDLMLTKMEPIILHCPLSNFK